MTLHRSLKNSRALYQPILPDIFCSSAYFVKTGEEIPCLADSQNIASRFPHTYSRSVVRLQKGASSQARIPLRVGVVFSGGQAPGGHNVIVGLFDDLIAWHPDSMVIGFLGGPSGLIYGKSRRLSRDDIDRVRNQGGFDLLGSDRTKFEGSETLEKVAYHVEMLSLDGLVIIGGDDSNTNAALLSEYFCKKEIDTTVVGVPKTIDGDLRAPFCELSFGFDTATKVYSEMIGNIGTDILSAKKYWHVVRLMGRSASHVALECALRTQPNIVLIGEEIAAKQWTLRDVVTDLASKVRARQRLGKNYGLILIPEGIIEFMPDIKSLINELTELLCTGHGPADLSKQGAEVFAFLPQQVQKALLMSRDPHGNVQLSQIQSEVLISDLVQKEMDKTGDTYRPIYHFFGYEGRSAFPSNFDATYCYALGHIATRLIIQKLTGYLCGMSGLTKSVRDWEVTAVPITSLIHLEKRHGKEKPVIQKYLVDLQKEPFLSFARARDQWLVEDRYQSPGPIQFFGDPEITDSCPLSLYIEYS